MRYICSDLFKLLIDYGSILLKWISYPFYDNSIQIDKLIYFAALHEIYARYT